MRFGTFSYNQARPWVSEKQAFEELLEQILLTERLSFDEAWFAEHHHSDYGLIASPNLMIASLAHRTKRLRLGNLVNVLPLYDPMRLAEECGMLDILTGGRLNVGLGRGVPRDDLKHGLDRDTAQARFEEGIEIMMRSWTEQTFSYNGKAWNYVDIVCRPRPLQRPHPPIYYGATSPDSPTMVARRGWNLALSRQPLANCAQAIRSYRDERAKHKNLSGNGDAIMVRDIYVAETDEQAWKEAVPQLVRFWQLATDNVWRGDSVSADDLPKFTERFPYFPGGLTVKRLDEWGTSLIGSPQTVIAKARAMIETAKPDSLVGMFSFGGLSHDQVTRSIELFATKVRPALGL
ncbi:MAG: Luciferase-like monooxygenase [Deltaproteobacteria bacterium]|jgi:alkanesulfonate monooxygenase SsuD/methylene tetrahydromethanopterin reductase-like flavin-dependent oxidoreductase (luciferase family)|nr:Luciferase-like monooxygenase [Deltaproteobacteria bacterium]